MRGGGWRCDECGKLCVEDRDEFAHPSPVPPRGWVLLVPGQEAVVVGTVLTETYHLCGWACARSFAHTRAVAYAQETTR